MPRKTKALFDPETGMSAMRELFCQFMAQVPPPTLAVAYKSAGYNWHYQRDTYNGKGELMGRKGDPFSNELIRIQSVKIHNKWIEDPKTKERKFIVKERIAELLQEAADKALVNTAATIKMMEQRNLADATEISGIRIGSCRYCWGDGNRYQRTVMEMQRDRETFETRLNTLLDSTDQADRDKAARMGEFDEKGGIGYNPNLNPNPECCECFGRGEKWTYFADTTKLSPEARSIYRGIQETKDGFKVITDREGAPALLPKIQGLLKDTVEHSGTIDVTTISPEEREARIAAIVAKANGEKPKE